ncbi:Ig-like domain-containing protein, partial [bacterium]|nr:Ig-like domain-containing protein [bacterium]
MNKIFYILSLTLIIANNAPVWIDIPIQTIDEDCNPCSGFPFDLEPYVTDDDNDPLTISISNDIEGATFSIDGFILDIVVDENWYGAVNFDVTASDGID